MAVFYSFIPLALRGNVKVSGLYPRRIWYALGEGMEVLSSFIPRALRGGLMPRFQVYTCGGYGMLWVPVWKFCILSFHAHYEKMPRFQVYTRGGYGKLSVRVCVWFRPWMSVGGSRTSGFLAGSICRHYYLLCSYMDEKHLSCFLLAPFPPSLRRKNFNVIKTACNRPTNGSIYYQEHDATTTIMSH